MEGLHAGRRSHGLHPGGLLQQFLARRIDTHPAGLPQRPIDRPRAPVPFFCGHLPIAIRRKLVHETIRRRVIGLPQIPYRPGNGGKQHEEIQLNVPAGLVQVVRTGDFRRENVAELDAGLFQDEVVRNHPGTVQDTVELSVLVFDGGNELLDLIEIAELQLPIAKPTGLSGQSV